MANYKIITDSACDLPESMLKQLDVTTTSLSVLFKGENRADTVEDHQIKEIYDGLRSGENATTSAANPEGWSRVIESVLAQGYDALVLAFSSALSTTYQSAVIAGEELKEKYPQRRIIVLDTLSAALGQGLLVWYACRKRDEGLSLDELAAWVEENKLHLCHWFTVNDLMYLKRGGRVSAATAVLGTMMNIKPVLHVDNEGRLINMEKDWDNEMVFICHGDCLEDAQTLEQILYRTAGPQRIFIGNLGAVIGSHAGPGTLAVFFLGDHR